MTTVTLPRHLQEIESVVDLRELAHRNHGYVPWCLRCLAVPQAGTMPHHAEELGHKGRGKGGR